MAEDTTAKTKGEETHTTHSHAHDHAHDHKASETHTTHSATAAGSKSNKMLTYAAAAVVIIIIVCAGALLYVHSSSKTTSLKSTTSTIPITQITSPHSGNTGIAAPNNPQALLALKKIENYTVTVPAFTVNYNGLIVSTVSEYIADSSGSPTSYLLPPTSTSGVLVSKYEKYQNNSRSYTSVTINQSLEAPNQSKSEVVNLSTYYSSNGIYYTCYNMTSTGCIRGNQGLGYSGQDPLSALNNFTISGLTLSNSTYNGMNCSALAGDIELNQSANDSFVETTGNFTACVLEPYNTALYLNINFLTHATKPYGTNGTTQNLQEGLRVLINTINITNSSSVAFVNFSDRNAT